MILLYLVTKGFSLFLAEIPLILTIILRLFIPPFYCQIGVVGKNKWFDSIILVWRVLFLLQLNLVLVKNNNVILWSWHEVFLLIWLFFIFTFIGVFIISLYYLIKLVYTFFRKGMERFLSAKHKCKIIGKK